MSENLQLQHLYTPLTFFYLYLPPQGSTQHSPTSSQLRVQTSVWTQGKKWQETIKTITKLWNSILISNKSKVLRDIENDCNNQTKILVNWMKDKCPCKYHGALGREGTCFCSTQWEHQKAPYILAPMEWRCSARDIAHGVDWFVISVSYGSRVTSVELYKSKRIKISILFNEHKLNKMEHENIINI